ncbi:metallophosphoesterase family protein [bacterium]|nr:metallophosphoesterase family protein [bacterium]
MLIALISDIHGNLEALEAARNIIEKIEPDKTICLGDVVGYGANPSECLQIIREMVSLCIAGNHDSAVAGLTHIDTFTTYAKEALLWTIKRMTPEEKKYLSALPMVYEYRDFLFVHASPSEPGKWGYIQSNHEAMAAFQALKNKICFVGHTHIPYVWVFMDEGFYPEESVVYRLESSKKYIVNIGSIGQPRDKNPKGSIMIFDTEQLTIKLIRFDYTIGTAQKKILEAGLPNELAIRLGNGI